MRSLENFIGEEFAQILPTTNKKGVSIINRNANGICLMEIHLEEENDLGRKPGNYYTLDLPDFSTKSKKRMITELGKIIKQLLPRSVGTLLILGMGNSEIISDSLGTKTVEKIDIYDLNGKKENLRVNKFCPGVVSVSGMESYDLTQAVVDLCKPDAVIVVDSLCTVSTDRLGTSIQVTDTGITPGSAVGSSICELSSKTLGGVKVISIGVPVVIYLKSVIKEIIQKTEPLNVELRVLLDSLDKMDSIFSPKDIDFLIDFLSGLVSQSIFEAI